MNDTYCGLNCNNCTYREPNHCGGCVQTEGHPFHGECPVAACCREKGHMHCGQCKELPCGLLTDYSCEPRWGDTPHGARIAQCIRWREVEECARQAFRYGGFNIYAENPEEVLAFYRALGLRVVHEPSPDSRWYGAELALQEMDSPVIWIWRLEPGAEMECKNHPVFHADCGLDAMYERIRAAGIKCDPPFTAEWGGRELILHDPVGSEILFL